ncbi:MAG: hypothetical protein WC959_05065 [Kiritimatiellales bacterium]
MYLEIGSTLTGGIKIDGTNSLLIFASAGAGVLNDGLELSDTMVKQDSGEWTTRCLVPQCSGVMYNQLWMDELWDR